MNLSKLSYYTFLCVVLTGSIVLSSCKDNDSDESNNGESPLALTITVENGNSYNSKIDSVKAEAFSENAQKTLILASTSYQNGGFHIILPYPLDDKLLSNDILSDVPSGVVVSDHTAKATIADFYGYKSGNRMIDADFIFGGFRHAASSNSLTVEITQASMVYCDKPVKITGSYTEEVEDGVSAVFTMNVSWTKGWNIVYTTQKTTIDALTGKITASGNVTLTKPAYNLKWYVGDDFLESITSELGINSIANTVNKIKPALFQLKK